MEIKQERLKSKVLWVSVTSALIMLLGHFGLYEKMGIDRSTVQYIVDTVLSFLVGFGILNNPTDAENF